MPNRKKLGLIIAIFFAFLGTFSLVAPTFSQFKSLQLSNLNQLASPFVPQNDVDVSVVQTASGTNILQNGGFETGVLGAWQLISDFTDRKVVMSRNSGVAEDSRLNNGWIQGDYFVMLWVKYDASERLSQVVRVPSNSKNAKLSFKISSLANHTPNCDHVSAPNLEVLINNNLVFTHKACRNDPPLDSPNFSTLIAGNFADPEIDLSNYIGKDVNIEFVTVKGDYMKQDLQWGEHNFGYFYLEDVAVTADLEVSAPIGYLDGVDSGIVAGGWACDTDTPNTPIEVHLYADKPVGQNGSIFLGNYVAGNDRPDLTGLCGGTTNHGFSISLDQIKQNKAHLMDGNMHPIHVYAINYNSQGNPSDENQNPHLEHSGGVWANRNFVYLGSSKIVDVIKNPSFENNLNWVVSPGELQFSKPFNGKEYSPLFGSKYAKLPSENGRAVKIQQTINIPNNLMHPKLVYFYHMSEPPNPVLGSAECNNGERFSSVEVIANGNGYQGKNYPICKGIGKSGWTKESLDLSALSGKTVNLVISNRTWDNDDTHNFLLDGIYLMADGIVERPDYCSSISLSTNELKEGETLTLTSTAKTNELKSFSFAFFNKDNLTTGENPTPKGIEYVPGEHFATVFVPLPNEPVYTGSTTVAYEDLFKPDTNWSNKIPESIQVNAYFTDGNNNTSQADEACVASFKLIHSAEGCVDLDGDDDCNPDVFDLLALLDVVLEPSTEYDIAFDIKQDSKVDVFDLIEFIDLYITN